MADYTRGHRKALQVFKFPITFISCLMFTEGKKQDLDLLMSIGEAKLYKWQWRFLKLFHK